MFGESSGVDEPIILTWESFVKIKTAGYGEVLRGVSFAPGTGAQAN
jgi:hypothetical protein